MWFLVTFSELLIVISSLFSFSAFISCPMRNSPSHFSQFPDKTTWRLLYLCYFLISHPDENPFLFSLFPQLLQDISSQVRMKTTNLQGERKCKICLSGYGLPHSAWSFLVGFIYLLKFMFSLSLQMITQIFITHLLIKVHICHFHILAIVNKAAMNWWAKNCVVKCPVPRIYTNVLQLGPCVLWKLQRISR